MDPLQQILLLEIDKQELDVELELHLSVSTSSSPCLKVRARLPICVSKKREKLKEGAELGLLQLRAHQVIVWRKHALLVANLRLRVGFVMNFVFLICFVLV